jgi:hypothetical protein
MLSIHTIAEVVVRLVADDNCDSVCLNYYFQLVFESNSVPRQSIGRFACGGECVAVRGGHVALSMAYGHSLIDCLMTFPKSNILILANI